MAAAAGSNDDTFVATVQSYFEAFLTSFSGDAAVEPTSGIDEAETLEYVEQFNAMRETERTTLFVDFQHLASHDSELADAVREQFHFLEPHLRTSVGKVMASLHEAYAAEKDFHVSFFNLPHLCAIRELRTDKIATLVGFTGTVTRTTDVRPELLHGVFQCELCQAISDPVAQQFKYTQPIKCKNPTCPNRVEWSLRHDLSKFIDWQRVRVQENASEMPPGCMPRTLDVILRGEMVERAKAGDKAVFAGSLVAVPDVAQMAAPGEKVQVVNKVDTRNPTEGVSGLKALGVRELTYKLAFLASSVQPSESRQGVVSIRDDPDDTAAGFTVQDKERILRMKGTPNVYHKLANSICPTVYGHEEVKRGILLMLFGGVHKESPRDHTKLRGDINCCLVGDPSTAKSQFLKFVCNMLPRAVYSSGKASSAAGLTATVTRDEESGEFCIEAGALMLSDNGICCIDEFDKMEPRDQVAIHEAMEQQTISIAKAGIQATLNARASILAAANPEGGRYDRKKSLRANLNLTSAIMSRFDLFFVLLDELDERRDYAIAKHIVGIHQHGSLATSGAEPDFTLVQLQQYIKFARSIKPVMSPEAARKLVEYYRELRQSSETDANTGSYRVTVRQLEALIRLGEARARVDLDGTIRVKHVQEARRLLRESIAKVDHDDVDVDIFADDALDDELERQAAEAEAAQRRRQQGDDNADDAGAGVIGRTGRNERGDRGDEGSGGSSGGGGYDGQGGGSADGGLDQPREPRAVQSPASAAHQVDGARRVKTCTYQKYKKVERSICVYIRGAESELGAGMLQADVVEWYLNQQEDIASVDDLAAERRLVKQIIQRLLTADKILLQVAPPYGSEPDETLRPHDARYLTVRPHVEL